MYKLRRYISGYENRKRKKNFCLVKRNISLKGFIYGRNLSKIILLLSLQENQVRIIYVFNKISLFHLFLKKMNNENVGQIFKKSLREATFD